MFNNIKGIPRAVKNGISLKPRNRVVTIVLSSVYPVKQVERIT